jgi:sugar phosphate permease
MSSSASVSVTGVTPARLSERAVQAPGWSLAAALLGFFMVTLDAVIVNVALPDMRRELAGGIRALLLHAVPARQVGVASGVFNSSRQVGGALAIAVFGALLADRATFLHGLRVSLLIAAAIALAAAAVSRLLGRPGDAPERGAHDRPGRDHPVLTPP